MSNVESWDRIAARARTDPPVDVISYGPDGPVEHDLRLIGDVAGKRVLDLGTGAGHTAVSFAKQGAVTIAVDSSRGQLDRARRLGEREDVRLEWHLGDLADLAFLRADSIDLAFSAFAISEVEDLDRLFRQVHRVLRANSVFVFSYEHPLALCTAPDPAGASGDPARLVVVEPYFTESPIVVQREGEPIVMYQRTVSEVFSALGRAGFAIETIVEPRPDRSPVPSTIVWRARKEGV
ncbi:MAG TPA: class I SAM-dependent methyltransferase [Acidimicrobiia bacterium]